MPYQADFLSLFQLILFLICLVLLLRTYSSVSLLGQTYFVCFYVSGRSAMSHGLDRVISCISCLLGLRSTLPLLTRAGYSRGALCRLSVPSYCGLATTVAGMLVSGADPWPRWLQWPTTLLWVGYFQVWLVVRSDHNCYRHIFRLALPLSQSGATLEGCRFRLKPLVWCIRTRTILENARPEQGYLQGVAGWELLWETLFNDLFESI